MSVTYEEALGTLNSMFGPPWTRDHLDSVLRHFEGHMENTVEAVLGHGDGTPESLISQLNGGGGPRSGPTNAVVDTTGDERLARQLSSGGGGGGFRDDKKPGGTPPPPPATPGFLGTPTELPADFLRVPESGNGGAKSGNDHLESDEALARMLQDDLFTEELANNPEFAHLARGRLPRANTQWRGSGSGSGNVRTSTVPAPDGPNVLDKLSEMGESAKRSLMLFARNFNDRNKGRPTGADVGQTETKGLLAGNNADDDEETYEMKTIGEQRQGKKLD